MEVVHEVCAGLDLHKRSVMACVLKSAGARGRTDANVKQFGTSTGDILEMADWLKAQGVQHVAMESTGVYWKPVWNLLESHFELLLCNAKHIKQVPGRKTDVKDSQWIAQLLRHGLLRASFVPPRPMRELRELTRMRVQFVEERTRALARMEKILEDANIKLGAVASNLNTKSARAIIKAIIGGETDPETLADLALGRLKAKLPQLRRALLGGLREHHRFLLGLHLDAVERIEAQIEAIDRRIDELARTDTGSMGGGGHPMGRAVELLQSIPGISEVSAEGILAEIGTDMSRFRTSGHLASWAGLCPGNNESAGRRLSGRIGKGNRWLRRLLVQCAWTAIRKKDSYLKAQFGRLKARRGGKRAIVATAHTLLCIIHAMLRTGASYEDLGGDYFDRRDKDQLVRRLGRRLKGLGFEVVPATS